MKPSNKGFHFLYGFYQFEIRIFHTKTKKALEIRTFFVSTNVDYYGRSEVIRKALPCVRFANIRLCSASPSGVRITTGIQIKKTKAGSLRTCLCFGRSEVIRTPDFFVPIEALYQTEPHPDIKLLKLIGRFFLRKNLRPEGRAHGTEPHPDIIYLQLWRYMH